MKCIHADAAIVIFKELVLGPELQTIGVSAKFHINYLSYDAEH